MNERKSHAIERYFEQIEEHLKICTSCREKILGCMTGAMKVYTVKNPCIGCPAHGGCREPCKTYDIWMGNL